MNLRWIFVIIFVAVLFALGVSPLLDRPLNPVPVAKEEPILCVVDKIDIADYKMTKALVSAVEINRKVLKENSMWVTDYVNDLLKNKAEKIEDDKWLMVGSKDKGHIHILPGDTTESLTQFTLTIQRLSERKHNNNYLIQANNILPTKNCLVVVFEDTAVYIKANNRIKSKIKYDNAARTMFQIVDAEGGIRIRSQNRDRIHLATFVLVVLSQYDNDIFEN